MSCARFAKAILVTAVVCRLLAPAATDAQESSEKPKKVTLASIVVRGALTEGPSDDTLSGLGLTGPTTTLLDLTDRLDKAAKDKQIAGVVLRLREPAFGLATADELRAAVARVRKAGKKVYADMEAGGTPDFLVAVACDQIVMPESGFLQISGLQAEVMFYKGLFDMVGVQPEFLQIGDFKGAEEPYTRKNMSPEFRKQFESVLDSYYDHIVKTIAADRKVSIDQVKKLIDTGLLTAGRAKDAGLIDRVAYADQFNDELKRELGADQLVFEKDYGKKKNDLDLSGLAGVMKLLEMLSGRGESSAASRGNKIALVYAVGAIMPGESGSSLLGDSTLGSDTLVKALRQADEDPTVKAIVMRVDSPGGSALASDLIWRQVVNTKKPLVVSMGSVAGSGGYYISMGAKKIFAEAGTLTGSIGVVSGKFAMRGLFDKVGVNVESISRGKAAGIFSSTDPFTPEERESLKQLSLDVYKQFTSKAAAGRKMDLGKLESLAQGKLYSGQMAVDVGLADKIGTLEDALAEVKTMAGLKPEDKTELLILPKPKNLFDQLLGGGSEAEIRMLPAEIREALKATQVLQKVFAEPAVTTMPFMVKFK